MTDKQSLPIVLLRRSLLHAAGRGTLASLAVLLSACGRSHTLPTALPVATPTIALPSPTPSARLSTAISPEARTYLDSALGYLQTHSVMQGKLDWQQVRADTLTQVSTAQTPADTYPAIRSAIQQLGDHHSFFLEPAQVPQLGQTAQQGLGYSTVGVTIVEVFPDSPAAQAGLAVGDIITEMNGTPAADLPLARDRTLQPTPTVHTRLTVTRLGDQPRSVTLDPAEYPRYRPPTSRRLPNDIGYLEIPGFYGTLTAGNQFATQIQHAICGLDTPPITGWVVDLRLDIGGSFWPMLAGLGPLLGEGEIGAFVDGRGTRFPWHYQAGRAWADNVSPSQITDAPYHLTKALAPLAVLTDDFTASGGEAVVVAFRGRPGSRSFGEATDGVPTGNDGTQLSDGAFISVTSVFDVDRTGRVYDAAIAPDEFIANNWRGFGTDRDPVLRAALTWLEAQRR